MVGQERLQTFACRAEFFVGAADPRDPFDVEIEERPFETGDVLVFGRAIGDGQFFKQVFE